jgi:hypothetical protein
MGLVPLHTAGAGETRKPVSAVDFSQVDANSLWNYGWRARIIHFMARSAPGREMTLAISQLFMDIAPGDSSMFAPGKASLLVTTLRFATAGVAALLGISLVLNLVPVVQDQIDGP